MLLWSGIVRGYYTDVNGSEHTDCFCARRGAPRHAALRSL